MKKLIAALAVLMAAMSSPASAAVQTIDFLYRVTFADLSVVQGTGLSMDSLFSGSATFDDSQILGDTVVIPSDGSAGTFALNFGNFVFTQANDLLGGPEIKLPSNLDDLPWLAFETKFAILSGEGLGEYLLSFSGTQFQMTPSGNTVDFKMTGVAAVPEPSTYALMIAGLGLIGFFARRRSSKER